MVVVHSRSSSELAADVLDCRTARTADDLTWHHRIREAVFVAEQGVFDGTDRDAFDTRRDTFLVVGFVGGVPAGTVRFYPVPSEQRDEALWKGDRLAVLPEHRHAGLGGPLVRFAVASAGALGGDRMIAYIQPDNVLFFERLGWTRVGEPSLYVGLPHQKMSIGLR
jgi:putative N-acetyltransferase (TIGR04045 family)